MYFALYCDVCCTYVQSAYVGIVGKQLLSIPTNIMWLVGAACVGEKSIFCVFFPFYMYIIYIYIYELSYNIFLFYFILFYFILFYFILFSPDMHELSYGSFISKNTK